MLFEIDWNLLFWNETVVIKLHIIINWSFWLNRYNEWNFALSCYYIRSVRWRQIEMKPTKIKYFIVGGISYLKIAVNWINFVAKSVRNFVQQDWSFIWKFQLSYFSAFKSEFTLRNKTGRGRSFENRSFEFSSKTG